MFNVLGICSVKFVSGIKPDSDVDPGAIDWGYGEVARVEAFESPAGCGLSAPWEGRQRRLDIELEDCVLLSPHGNLI